MPKPKNEVPEKRFLNTREASLYTGIPASTLRKYRHEGRGPNFTKPAGRVFYEIVELDRFMDSGRRIHADRA